MFEPSTGIGLHNRGIGFSLVPGHPAEYGPGRRPPHTLAPLLVTNPDGSLAAAVGTMGGDSQPQILLQLLARWLHHGQPPGQAVAAPRWTLVGSSGFDTWRTPDPRVQLEHGAPPAWEVGLAERGHPVSVAPPQAAHAFGHAHLLAAHPAGGWAGAADPRAEVGAARGY